MAPSKAADQEETTDGYLLTHPSLAQSPSEGDFLPPHPQVTPRCGPFLHRELKDEREVLEGIELSILGLTVERAELSQVVTPSERKSLSDLIIKKKKKKIKLLLSLL